MYTHTVYNDPANRAQRAIDLTRQLAEARQDRINEAQAASCLQWHARVSTVEILGAPYLGPPSL